MPKVFIEKLGQDMSAGISNLQVVKDAPDAGAPLAKGMVLVDVRAAAVNFPDLLMTYGGYQYKPKVPYVPGTEASGVVMAVSEGVKLAVGDRVIVGGREGCMQSPLVAPAVACSRLPQGLSFQQGAAFSVAYSTAYHCLIERGQLRPEDVVLINGATGGVGLAAVEIARAVGCRRIIATGSSPEKLSVVTRCGATDVYDLASEKTPVSKLGDALKELTGGRGVDVVYDPVGGEVFEQSLRGTAWAARVLIVGFASNVRPVVRANYALIKGLTVMGCRAGESVRNDPSLAAPRAAQLRKWVEEGALRPHVSHLFPVWQAQEAFKTVAERRVTGKAVIVFKTAEQRSRL